MEPTWAEETLRDRYSDLTAKGVYNLALAATGDEGVAQDAMSDKIAEDLRNNQKVEL